MHTLKDLKVADQSDRFDWFDRFFSLNRKGECINLCIPRIIERACSVTWLISGYMDWLIEAHKSDEVRLPQRDLKYREWMFKKGWLEIMRQTEHTSWYHISVAGRDILKVSLAIWLEKEIHDLDEGIKLYEQKAGGYSSKLYSMDTWRVQVENRLKWLASFFYDAWATELIDIDAIDEQHSTMAAWLDINRIPAYKRPLIIQHINELFGKRAEERRSKQAEEARQLAWVQLLKDRNLIEGGAYMKKYGLIQHCEFEVLDQVIPCVVLNYAGRSRDYDARCFEDRPLTDDERIRLYELARCSKGDAAIRLGIEEKQLEKLLKKHGIQPTEKRYSSGAQWGYYVYKLADIEGLRPHLHEAAPKPPPEKHITIWKELTSAERKLLQRLFEADQEAEENEEAEKDWSGENLPAAVWRWVDPPRNTKLATLESLKTKGLILLEDNQAQMTRQGRAIIRANTSKQNA